MVSSSIILKDQTILNINQFLDLYREIDRQDLDNLLESEFELDYSTIKKNSDSHRICPVIQLAEPKDAKVISEIFKQVYRETYPYKKMESEKGIIDMINSPQDYWFIFRLDLNETIGAFGAHLDFEEKRGLLYGFVIKKKYQRRIDIFKAFMVCAMYLWTKFQKELLVWYGEIRTNETAAQHTTSFFGLKPIAFLPNKDIFFNQIESDLLHVIYNRDVLFKYRKSEKPKIIRQVLNSYSYTNKRFNLGLPIITNPKIEINKLKLEGIKRKVVTLVEEKDYGNKSVTILNKDTQNFLSFIYNPYSKNFEKTDYLVDCLEELNAFLDKLVNLIEDWKINYFECYVSAYNPEHQMLFNNLGFKARGYIPCWKYSEDQNIFEDRILFNYITGRITENMRIIPEAKELIDSLDIPEENLLKLI
ncbi:MAG: hypothetical protein EU535_06965 [Promethearchaeota archaeon]|nr:MAG: hypothetical protein EU535_06965 [Candidatus Lokiarchaeota archaeon]